MYNPWIKLLIIILVGAGLRLVVLDRRPKGFSWDEAALGYNAYSLLHTGRDEYGQALPVVLKSFGDYKPGLYAYLTVPSVGILGLNEYATRLPAALAGILLIAAVYLLTRQMAPALILALNPWAIQFSRAAWEANVCLLFTVLGAVLFMRRRFYTAALFFGLTVWTYQGAKLFTPLILLTLVITYAPSLNWRQLIKPLLLLAVLLSPIVFGLSSQSGRLKVYSLFSYHRQETDVENILHQDNIITKGWPYYLWHSETYDQLRGIVQRYTNSFSPQYLFFLGDWTNGRQATPYYGYFHLPEVVLLLLGLYWLIKQSGRSYWWIWGWLLLAPMPAALSRDLVSGVRSLPMVIPLTVIMGIGLTQLAKHKLLLIGFLVTWVFLVGYFVDLYFIHSPFQTDSAWLAAYKPALAVVQRELPNYQHMVFTNQLGQPYIFTLFYLAIDPRHYQQQAKLVSNSGPDVGEVNQLDKFIFRPIYWPEDRKLKSTLFVGGQYELPLQDVQEAFNLGDVNYANGQTALRIVGNP